MGQSKASFGICHPGARWPHGSLAQRMIYESHQWWDKLIEELEIEFQRIGELALAFDEEEIQHLQLLKAQGDKNGVQGLELLSKQETLRLEPSVNPNVRSSLYLHRAGIFNPFELVLAFYENAKANGVDSISIPWSPIYVQIKKDSLSKPMEETSIQNMW